MITAYSPQYHYNDTGILILDTFYCLRIEEQRILLDCTGSQADLRFLLHIAIMQIVNILNRHYAGFA